MPAHVRRQITVVHVALFYFLEYVYIIYMYMYSPTPLIRTSNNQIFALYGLQVTFPFLFAQIAILCMFESNIFILITIYRYFVL